MTQKSCRDGPATEPPYVSGRASWQVGMARDEVVVLIHSGSRTVGRYVGNRWMAKARESWPAGLAHPQSGLYGLIGTGGPRIPDRDGRGWLEEEGLNVHRKGLTPAHAGQLALIPGSMGTLLSAGGTGLPEWLASCSHGAGRAVCRQRMRRAAREQGGAWRWWLVSLRC